MVAEGLGEQLQLVFSGHEHAFSTLNFAADADKQHYPNGRPAQLVVGGSGTQLEAADPESPLYEAVAGSKERRQPDGNLYEGLAASSGILLNRHSFLLLERQADGWRGTVFDPEGQALSRCHLAGKRKLFECNFPRR